VTATVTPAPPLQLQSPAPGSGRRAPTFGLSHAERRLIAEALRQYQPAQDDRAAWESALRKTDTPVQPYSPCANCAAALPRHPSRGLCQACYGRWRRAGFPATGVPDLQDGTRRARQIGKQRLQARMEDYFFLRDLNTPIEEAARRVGIRAKTAQRYETGQGVYRRRSP
jgi:hypothetical protein